MNKILEALLLFFYCIFPCFKKKTNNTETSKDDFKIVVDQINDTDENLLMKLEAKRLKGTYNLRSKSIPTRRNLRPRFEGGVVQPGPEEGLRQQERGSREERLRVAQEEILRERRNIQSRLRHLQQEQSRAHRQEQIQANRGLPPETAANNDQTMLSELHNEFNGSFLNSINVNNSPDDRTFSMVFTNVNGVNNMRLVSSENGEITFQMTFVNEQYKKIDNKVFKLHRVEHFDNRDVDESDSESDDNSPIIQLQSDMNRILLQQQEAENRNAPVPLEIDHENSPERMDTSEVFYNTAPAEDVDSGLKKTLKRLIKNAKLKPNDLYLCRMKRDYDLSGKRTISKPELFTFKARHHTSNQRLAISANIIDQKTDKMMTSQHWRIQRESMDIDPDQNMSCTENQFQNSRADASNLNLPSTSGSNIYSQSQFPSSTADASNSNLPSTSGSNIFSQSQFSSSRANDSNSKLPRSSRLYAFPQQPEDPSFNSDSKLPRASGYISRSKLPQNQEISSANNDSNSNVPSTSGSNIYSQSQFPSSTAGASNSNLPSTSGISILSQSHFQHSRTEASNSKLPRSGGLYAFPQQPEDPSFNSNSKLPRASGYISRRKLPQNQEISSTNDDSNSNLPSTSGSNILSQSQFPSSRANDSNSKLPRSIGLYAFPQPEDSSFNPDSKRSRTNEYISRSELSQNQEINPANDDSHQAPKNFNPDSMVPRSSEFIYKGKLAQQNQETTDSNDDLYSNLPVKKLPQIVGVRFEDLNQQTSTPKTEQNKVLKQLLMDKNQATQRQPQQPINKAPQALSPVLGTIPTPRLVRSNAFNNLSNVASNTRIAPTNQRVSPRLARNQDENQDLNQRIITRKRDDSDESDEVEDERLASKSKKRKC